MVDLIDMIQDVDLINKIQEFRQGMSEQGNMLAAAALSHIAAA